MVVDERSRHALHTELERLLGADHADTMMSMLPPVGWADIATKRDLDAFATSIRLELHTEIAGLRDELHTGLAEVRTELHREISQMTRTMVFSMTGALATMGGLAFAAASLV